MIIKLIQLIPEGTKIDFFGHRFYGLFASCVIIFGTIFCLATKGLNFGIDFTGGTLIEVSTPADPDIAGLRHNLNTLKMGDISIQEFGGPQDLLIRLPQQDGGPEAQKAAVDAVRAALGEKYGEGKVDFRRTEFVGPQVGEELKKTAMWAVLFSMAGILAYVWFRFEWQYGVGAILALLHDVVGTVGLFSLTQMQFDLATLAAVLLVAGYSINDTVIIFDRVRENLRKYKKATVSEMINLSINQTLNRTAMTAFTTLIALLALYMFGGEVIRGFVAALFFGIAIGVHSSYFIACPPLHYLNVRRSTTGNTGNDEAEAGEAGPA
ncbi:MAG: protein translocase subunit SecF [Proteobacteria bacterium]|nr:protein translocase subunit SecF [Pseudomonadota bacterium]